MTTFGRRTFFSIGMAFGLIGRGARAAAANCSRAVHVGAIRWDAWYDPRSAPGRATTASLSPSQYHFRLPFFAKILPDSSIEIDGDQQSIIDQEIDYAASAGLGYWAFVAYAYDNPMSNALRLYLKSKKKDQMNFCMISAVMNFAHAEIIDWHIRLLNETTYQTVLDRRPLYFLGPFSDNFIQETWGGLPRLRLVIDEFRRRVRDSGTRNPYIVALHQDAGTAARYARTLGCDAIGAYAVNHNDRTAPFSELVKEAEQEWREHAATGLSVVPLVTTGFDRRPRIDHPVPWEKTPTPAGVYYDTASPQEIAGEFQDCLEWMARNRAAAPSNAILVYAWNENDEGGWLIPTKPADRSRLDAVEKILCPR